MINRSAIIVRVRQPFLDWLRQLPDPVEAGMTLDSVNHEPTVYLLPEYDSDADCEQLLACFHDIVFESQLEGWWTSESDWPLVRDLNAFKEWFSVEFHSVIEDLVDEPIVDDDLTAE